MPIEFFYLVVVFVVAIVGFTLLKRPLHECMLAAFIVIVALTGTWGNVGQYIWDAMTESSLYVIIVFVVSAMLLSKTSVIDDCIAIILSIFGRLRGGAGFVSIIGSTYMGSLSGSGPGNVATTGVFTIPAMKKTGFPAHLAANVEAHASTMGNMIPPAGMIAVAFALVHPNPCIKVATGISSCAMADVIAAKKIAANTRNPMTLPSGNCENSVGRMMKIRPEPASGLRPIAIQAGIMAMPAMVAMDVSSKHTEVSDTVTSSLLAICDP